jgi:hypothetical protein
LKDLDKIVMTREEKIKLVIEKGYKYDPETGDIFKPSGDLVTTKSTQGYVTIRFSHEKKKYMLYGHHFAYYMINEYCPYKIDHKNRQKVDNKIRNLRESNYLIDNRNQNNKGYTFDKDRNKWRVMITVNYKTMFIGRFNTEEEARNAYLEAKRKYHPEFNV